MPAVQIRNLPQGTYDLLRAEAQASGRSINKHTEAILVDYFAAKSAAGARQVDAALPAAKQTNANPFRMEAPREVEERAARRSALFARIDANEAMPIPDEWDATSIVRKMRDKR